jgi:hypothetical protein
VIHVLKLPSQEKRKKLRIFEVTDRKNVYCSRTYKSSTPVQPRSVPRLHHHNSTFIKHNETMTTPDSILNSRSIYTKHHLQGVAPEIPNLTTSSENTLISTLTNSSKKTTLSKSIPHSLSYAVLNTINIFVACDLRLL